MKIYITYDYEDHNRIRSIKTLEYFISRGNTEEEIDAKVKSANEKDGFETFKKLEVSDEIASVLRFALGEDEYKTYAEITDVYDRLNDIKCDLDSMQSDCFHMCEYVESAMNEVKDLVPEDERY